MGRPEPCTKQRPNARGLAKVQGRMGGAYGGAQVNSQGLCHPSAPKSAVDELALTSPFRQKDTNPHFLGCTS